jgi:phosphatidylglycerophosphatase A
MRQIMRNFILLIGSGAGIGYLPRMPGTFGTLVGLPVSLAINRLEQAYPPLGVGALVGLAIVAIVVAGHAARLLGAKDPQIIVIDEIAGFALANFLSDTATAIVGAFVLFRLFDIAKVYPARQLERVTGGAGVVLDDLLAGLYVFVILRLLSWMAFL